MRYRKATPGKLEQGLILRDLRLPEYQLSSKGEFEVSFTEVAFVVVLTQDCDLERDEQARLGAAANDSLRESHCLRMILVCPAFDLEAVQSGTYLRGGRRWGSKERQFLERDGDSRFHRLRPDDRLFGHDLVCDFRLLMGCHPTWLRNWFAQHPESGIAVLDVPSRDRLSQRFVGYISRIAEPDEEAE